MGEASGGGGFGRFVEAEWRNGASSVVVSCFYAGDEVVVRRERCGLAFAYKFSRGLFVVQSMIV